MDTLAVRLAVPLIGPAKVFHLLGLRPAGRTKKRGDQLVAPIEARLPLAAIYRADSRFLLIQT